MLSRRASLRINCCPTGGGRKPISATAAPGPNQEPRAQARGVRCILVARRACQGRTRAKKAPRSGGGAYRRFSLDDAEDVAFLHDQELIPIDLDLGARPFAKQPPVAFLDIERYELAGLVARSGSDGEDLALHRLFFRRVGDDDTAGGLGLLFDATHDHAIVQRAKLHGLYLTPSERIFLSF